jgi:hypothetical protein
MKRGWFKNYQKMKNNNQKSLKNRRRLRQAAMHLVTWAALAAEVLHAQETAAAVPVTTMAAGPATTTAPATGSTASTGTPTGLAMAPANTTIVPANTRYGMFNWLDHRSAYGQGVYPEPFLVDDSDLEVNEARLDWLYQAANGQQTNLVTAEVEKGFGELTLEVEAPYEYNTAQAQVTQGTANIDLGARYPIYQYVSKDGMIDTTFGVAAEVGVPTYSSVSKNTEFVPKVFNDLKVGNHFTLQSILGYSMLYGGSPDGGVQTFEYGFVFGYTIPHAELPIPNVEELIPVLELSGGTQTTQQDAGVNSLEGDLAVRFNLKPIGKVQPRLGIGYVFPLSSAARDDVHWGIITSLVFEY